MLWSVKCSLFLRYSAQRFVCAKKHHFIIDSLYIVPHAVHRAMKNIFLNLFDGMLRRSSFPPDRSYNTEYETLCYKCFCKCLDEEKLAAYFVRLSG